MRQIFGGGADARGSVLPGIRHALILAAMVGFWVMGCSNSDSPTTPTRATPPIPNSPVNAVRLLEWCWEQRSVANYAPLLTADFAFVFAPGDSAGGHFPDRSLTRAQELAAAQALFVSGAGTLPKASAIQLDLGTVLVSTPDPRPGKHPTWHQTVDLRFDLTVNADTASYRAIGGSTFYLVREDSAQVPLETSVAGDSARWYLERWEERPTITAGPFHLKRAAEPRSTGRSTTWGYLKWFYLGSPSGAFGGFGSP